MPWDEGPISNAWSPSPSPQGGCYAPRLNHAIGSASRPAVATDPTEDASAVEPTPRRATFDDLAALPDDERAEVIDGHVVTSPAPLPRHARVSGALRRFVGGPFDDDDGRGGPGGWWIFQEVDVRFGPHDILRPDLAGWRRDRLPSPWDTRPIDVVPDWVCEVVSPSNPAHDRVTKLGIYRDAGVPHYWLVDPAARIVEALARKEAAYVLTAFSADAGDAVAIPPFGAVSLELDRLFPPE